MNAPWFNDPTTYSAVSYNGREVRIYKGIKAHDALMSDPTALHNAATGAARMPFAFTANCGVVIADRIES